ncbi:hypothetical protein ABZP36_032765 [Zizania latifolia]
MDGSWLDPMVVQASNTTVRHGVVQKEDATCLNLELAEIREMRGEMRKRGKGIIECSVDEPEPEHAGRLDLKMARRFTSAAPNHAFALSGEELAQSSGTQPVQFSAPH